MKNNFSAFIKMARVSKGWSQLRLSHELFDRYGFIIDPSSISRYERGEVCPDFEVMAMLAEILGFSLDSAFNLAYSGDRNESLVKKIALKLARMDKAKLVALDAFLE